MLGMNAEVREVVHAALERKGLTQAELARRIGMERANLHRLLSGKSGRVPEAWQKIFDELGLELTAKPKEGELDLEGYRYRRDYIDQATDEFLQKQYGHMFNPEQLAQIRPHFRQAIQETELFYKRQEWAEEDKKGEQEKGQKKDEI